MSDYDIAIQVFEEFAAHIPETWLREVVARALAVESVPPPAAVSVVIADDDVVRELNNRHRGLDETTDVLAFSFRHRGEYHGEGGGPSEHSEDVEFVLPPGEPQGLGELVVSYPQARRQAGECGHPVKRELAVLLVHGILHLLGCDHVEPGEQAAMQERAANVLARLSDRV